MALAHVQKTIGGVLYTFGKLPAVKGRPIHLALARVIAEALKGGSSLAALTKAGGESTADESAAQAAALLGVLDSVASEDWTTPDGRRMMGLDTLMDRMFEHVTTKETAGAITVDFFDGRPPLDMYKVLAEALRFNFADFLGASLSRSPQGEAPPA